MADTAGFFNNLDEALARDTPPSDLDIKVEVTAPTAAAFVLAIKSASQYFGEPTRLGEGTTHMEARFDNYGLLIKARLELIQEMREEQTLTDIVNKRLQGDAP